MSTNAKLNVMALAIFTMPGGKSGSCVALTDNTKTVIIPIINPAIIARNK